MRPSGFPRPEQPNTSSRIARRGFIVGAVALGGVAALGAGQWFNVSAQVTGDDLTAPEALEHATAGDVILVDIRRPDEWARTGVGQGAIPLDMRRHDFVDALLAQTKGATDVPVALICARGVRSARMTARLKGAGFTRIIDVPEGMLGSGAGPGWIKRGLPVYKP